MLDKAAMKVERNARAVRALALKEFSLTTDQLNLGLSFWLRILG
jgi:hypothetical protein